MTGPRFTASLGLAPEQAEAVSSARALTIVAAGAGVGKTFTMACRYVELALAAADERLHKGQDPSPALTRIAAVTFTERAAEELAERIAGVLREVARAPASPGEHPAVRAFAATAADLTRELAIGTIHGLCARILRQSGWAGAAGMDLQVLDRLDASLLWSGALAEATDECAAAEPEVVRSLLAERLRLGSLVPALSAIGLGLEPAELEALAQRTLAEHVRQATEWALEVLHLATRSEVVRAAVDRAVPHQAVLRRACGAAFQHVESLMRWAAGQGSPALLAEGLGRCTATERRLAGLDPEAAGALEAVSACLAELQDLGKLGRGLEAEAIAAEHAWAGALARVGVRARRAYEAAKRSRGALDFADLERHALAALQAGFRRPFEAILLDEFQDTSPIQVRLLEALAGPALSGVLVVGDPKQSIYRFRGAEVSVFQRIVDRSGQAPLGLASNRRSRPGVIALVNALFARIFKAPHAPWEVRAQRLLPVRTPGEGALPPLVLVPWDARDAAGAPLAARELRAREAQVVAETVARLDRRGARQVAVLLRAARGERRVYADRIGDRGMPVAVDAGGTFTSDAAVACGIALCRALALPGHLGAWAAVLRGPVVGLEEATIARVMASAQRCRTLVIDELNRESLWWGRGSRVVRLLVSMVDEPGALVDRCRSVMGAAGIASRQLDKLWAMIASLEARGAGPLEIAEWLEALDGDDRETRVADPSGVERVRVSTIHAAKGLEFETVVVPQLGEDLRATLGRPGDLVRDLEDVPRFGPVVPGQDASVGRIANRWLEGKRAEAEAWRLLYVALTRAREHLVLVLPRGLPARGRPVGEVLGLLGGLDLDWEGPAVLDLGEEGRVPVEVWPVGPDTPGISEEAAPAPEPAQIAPFGEASAVVGPPARWPATRLGAFAYCPAYLAQEEVAPFPRDQAGERSGPERGTLVHRMLEGWDGRSPLAIPPELAWEGADLEARIRRIAADPLLAEGFAPDARIAWELPLELEASGVTVVGTLDRVALWELPGGRLRAMVVDFKTGVSGLTGPGGRHPSFFAAYRFQMAAYAAMLAGVYGDRLADPILGRLAFVDRGRVVASDWSATEAGQAVEEVIARLRDRRLQTPAWHACGDCRMQPFCAVARRPSP
jgi:ATP-dependent helicase/nuclease subunit A